VQGCSAGVLVLTARHVVNGDMAVGDFIAVNTYATNAFAPLGFLGTVYTAVVRGFGGGVVVMVMMMLLLMLMLLLLLLLMMMMMMMMMMLMLMLMLV
jgi:hypothetical protein